MMQWEGNLNFVAFFPQTHNLSLMIRQTQHDGYPIKYLTNTSQKCQGQEKLRNCHRADETKETWYLKAM